VKLLSTTQGKLNPFRCLLHPFDGFYAIKEEKGGSILAAAAIICVFIVSALLKRQNTGYIFNYADLSALNLWLILTKTVVLYGLWSACNWAVSTWMDGEGKAAEILIVSAYSLIPYIAATLLTTLLSNVLLQEEGAFLQYILVIAILWSGVLMIIGMGTIHDYGFVKNLQSIVLTFIAMGIVVFLTVLFYTLLQQLYVFFYTLYNEMLFRL